MSQTYAQYVNGKVISMDWDHQTKEFELRYMVTDSNYWEMGVTQIYVAKHFHYPNGYQISVEPQYAIERIFENKQRSCVMIQTNALSQNIVINVNIRPL